MIRKSFIAASLLLSAAIGILHNGAAAAQAANPPPTTYAYGQAGQAIAPLYGGLLGSYAKTLTSGTIGAGASAASPIYSMRYTGPGVAVVKRVTVAATSLTAFAAGVGNIQLFAARAFTASDSGGTAGTLTGNNGKLRTSFATTAMGDIRVSSTAALTPGTRTLDTDPLGGFEFGIAGATPTADTTFVPPGTLLINPKNAGDYPLVLATNEGFVIQATVPITGTWTASVFVEWDEYANY